MTLPAENRRYTFADCLNWPESDRVELIDGEIYLMTPPVRKHQKISVELLRQLANYLDGKSCEVYAAPFGVRLFEQAGDDPEDVDTMVEPDLSVICDPDKLDDYGCKGAPDMVIEILSPTTRRHDRVLKMNLYQRAGVREYWLVDPDTETVLVFLLGEDGAYHPHEDYSRGDTAKVNVLEDCFVELSKVFTE